MKKSYIYTLLALLMLPVFGACSKEEITFDCELPAFDTREGYQLLEMIAPLGTKEDDKIYIVGEFNGGEAAIGNPEWELEHSTTNDAKWGIYLNPSTYQNGKTLADGYYFYSKEQGRQVSLENDSIFNTENPAVGQRANVIVWHWAQFFEKPANPDEIVHDGYTVYVVDETGWDELAMYAWGDAEAFGSWPGMTPTGKVTIDGVNYKYFDTGASNEGMNLHLIFNNNDNGSQLKDFDVTLNQDFYLKLTTDGVVDFDPADVVQHDGYAIFVHDTSDWDELWLYMWGTVNNLNGDWPGMEPTGTQVINGVTYKYFDLGAANCDGTLEEHLILNNGDNGKQVDDVVVFNLDRDVYLDFNGTKAVEIEDPSTFVPGGNDPEPVEPTPDPETYYIYAKNATGWSDLYVYAWGGEESFGEWPGTQMTETISLGGEEYFVIEISGYGQEENLIFNNGKEGEDKAQLDDFKIECNGDFYLDVKADGVAQIEPVDADNIKLFIEDKTGWDALYVYSWGKLEAFGGWPGAQATATETVDGVTYKVLTVQGNPYTNNVIFNANQEGVQYDAFAVKFTKDLYIVANEKSAEIVK